LRITVDQEKSDGKDSCGRCSCLSHCAVSVATAAEPEGALVESINGNSLDVQPMDFVPVGQIIRARMGRLC
jgi:hypothetical protein